MSPQSNGTEIQAIAQAVLHSPGRKPITRQALHPGRRRTAYAFDGQRQLTKPLLERYIDRAVVHMSTNSREPEVYSERGRQFLRDTGALFLHWADLGWVRVYGPDDWRRMGEHIDAVHASEWGADVLFECGLMEAIGRNQIDNTPIPTWMLELLKSLGIHSRRRFGPNGPECFSYEAMFDREASDWPKHLVGLWSSNPASEQSVPDITMLETQLYYAMLIAEHLDAGFEGIMFGQTVLTGARDTNNAALAALCRFARQWAAARAWRRAVTLTSHVFDGADYPKAPLSRGRPLFTHLTWPTRLSCAPYSPYRLRMGPDIKRTATRQGGEEIAHLLTLPHDLPILLEIDNYGGGPGVNEHNDDEITAFAAKPPQERREFLRRYYHECRTWTNAQGHRRVFLAMPGYRVLNRAVSLFTLPDGTPAPPVRYYIPFREAGGEEDLIRELFHATGKKERPK